MSDVSKAATPAPPQRPIPQKPRPEPTEDDGLFRDEQGDGDFQPKGPVNTGGWGTAVQDDGLFRDEQSEGEFKPKGPVNTGGYNVKSKKDRDVTREDASPQKDAPPEDPLFTDKVDIKFGR